MVGQDGEWSVRAVLEPVTSLSWQNMRRQMRALGQVPQGQFLYLGEADISQVPLVRKGETLFAVRRCEEISLGGKRLFYWGLCVPAGKEEAWSV